MKTLKEIEDKFWEEYFAEPHEGIKFIAHRFFDEIRAILAELPGEDRNPRRLLDITIKPKGEFNLEVDQVMEEKQISKGYNQRGEEIRHRIRQICGEEV